MKKLTSILLATLLALSSFAAFAAEQGAPNESYPEGHIVFLRQPEDLTTAPGLKFTLSVTAFTVNPESVDSVVYQWYERLPGGSWAAVAGETGPEMTLSALGYEFSKPRALEFKCIAGTLSEGGGLLEYVDSRAAVVTFYWTVGQICTDWAEYIVGLFAGEVRMGVSVWNTVMAVLRRLFIAPWEEFFLLVEGQFNIWFKK